MHSHLIQVLPFALALIVGVVVRLVADRDKKTVAPSTGQVSLGSGGTGVRNLKSVDGAYTVRVTPGTDYYTVVCVRYDDGSEEFGRLMVTASQRIEIFAVNGLLKVRATTGYGAILVGEGYNTWTLEFPGPDDPHQVQVPFMEFLSAMDLQEELQGAHLGGPLLRLSRSAPGKAPPPFA
jgi:hypothetical protein